MQGDLIDKLTKNHVNPLEQLYQESSVVTMDIIAIPRFKLTQQCSVLPILHNIGVKSAFSAQTAQFKISEAPNFSIGDIIHSSSIHVDEEGSTLLREDEEEEGGDNENQCNGSKNSNNSRKNSINNHGSVKKSVLYNEAYDKKDPYNDDDDYDDDEYDYDDENNDDLLPKHERYTKVNPDIFVLDRPFLFIVKHVASNTIAMIGQVFDPIDPCASSKV